jgi:hypothetical protein
MCRPISSRHRELPVARAHERFDAWLRLKEEGKRKVLGDLLARFNRWIGQEPAAGRRSGSLNVKTDPGLWLASSLDSQVKNRVLSCEPRPYF